MQWSLAQLKGDCERMTPLALRATTPWQAGVRDRYGQRSQRDAACSRACRPLPWEENFDSAAPGPASGTVDQRHRKFSVREMEGNKVLVKLADNPFTKRARASTWVPTDWRNYTVEADFSAIEKRRQLGDAGVVAQRYNLILFGNHQRLELESWQPETKRTVPRPSHGKATPGIT